MRGIQATMSLGLVNTLVDGSLNCYRGIIAGKEKTVCQVSLCLVSFGKRHGAMDA